MAFAFLTGPFPARSSLRSSITPNFMCSQYSRVLSLLLLTAAAACNRGAGGAPASGPAGGGRGAAAVGVVTLQEKPVEISSDFISTVRSLNSVLNRRYSEMGT